MNSPKPDFDDELGHLIRDALQDRTDMPEPSDEIWTHIKEELETAGPPAPPRKRAFLPPPVVQAVFIILLIFIGGISLQPPSLTDESLPILSPTLTGVTPGRFIDEYSASPGVEVPVDEVEWNLMKGSRAVVTEGDELVNPTAVAVPVDVIPHPNSPEGRMLASSSTTEISEPVSDSFFGLNPFEAEGLMMSYTPRLIE